MQGPGRREKQMRDRRYTVTGRKKTKRVHRDRSALILTLRDVKRNPIIRENVTKGVYLNLHASLFTMNLTICLTTYHIPHPQDTVIT